MGIFILLLACLIVYKISFSSFQNEYLGKEQSIAIKGIFAVIIFLSHSRGYIEIGNSFLDHLFMLVMHAVGQSMVSMFFFYSGYGILLSYQNKMDYEKHFFRNRLIKTLIHFDLAVFLYVILNLCFGKIYSLKTYLLSMIGLVSIRNSNWFICVILMLYLITWISFVMINMFHVKKKENICYIVLCLSLLMWVLLYQMKLNGYWYNTLLCYPVGMIYGRYKDEITSLLRDHKKYVLSLICILGIMLMCYMLRGNNVIYSIYSIMFSLMVVFMTSRVRIQNQILLWIGKYSFSIYILQRIPMILLSHFGVENEIVFVILAWICTALMAYCFEMILKWVDRNVIHC
ncbi:MAG: acyltransferase family protein [Erysipelotrichaceae bacterium]|nr:acyltransferase family protein [Erysipelotrichaceae bacterium]